MMKSVWTFIWMLSFIHLQIGIAQQLTVAPSKSYLQTSDGKPFIWIGDTAWELFHKLNREEVDEYLTVRMKQGFTVIYTVILAEHEGLTVSNAYGEVPLHGQNPAKPNLRYFEHVDYVINKAQSLGLRLAVLPTWGNNVQNARDGKRPYIFTPQNAYQYGNFLGDRYKDKSIIWVLGGDRNVDNGQAKLIWDKLAEGIRAGNDDKQLMSYHPAGESSSAYWFHKSTWLDFNMYQTGHARRSMPGYQYAEAHRLLDPQKPFLDAEPAYEDIPIKFWEYLSKRPSEELIGSVFDTSGIIIDRDYFEAGFFTDKDVRQQAYWGLLSGAMGFSYGNNAVWQFVDTGKEYVVPSLYTWREALTRPGAEQIKHLRFFMENWDFSTLVPDQSLIYGVNRSGASHIRAATNADKSCIYVYTPVSQVIVLNLSLSADTVYKVSWFDPRNGEIQHEEKVISNGPVAFIPPAAADDCVLILELKK
ncbi:glycoside hydrolase family 140 protein [Sphingobacterium chuzhouense]|uniref:Glycoside hydrolase family 140 protein n=1 Tax=Sphingobacterium chuzhouense TaxID=1742264 RepID=A0ABR7XXY5_9SPHI|nr:glycoside hydrolase family 140 protein [Sphingobacterium chuzhouense]MBD1423910.1 glycoside hydrolase family 140 protein [Sphingobacterium chuzhouense]